MLTTIERVLFLRDVPLLAGLPTQALAHLAILAEEERLATGTPLWRRGARSEHLFFIIDGAARIDGAGPVALAGPRCDLGATALLRPDATRESAAIAIRPTTILRIGREDVFEVLAEYPDATRPLLEAIGRRLEGGAAMDVGAPA